jgi:thiamine transport system permease protein
VLVAFGFLLMFGRLGYLNQLLMSVFGLREPPIELASGLVGIVLAHVFYNVPVVIQMVSTSWRRIHPEVEEAAKSLGSRGFHKFRRVTLPLIMPAILASALLTFTFCFLSFAIVTILGGVEYRTMEVQIYSLYKTFMNFHSAAALAFIQLICSLTFAYLYMKALESYTAEEKVGRVEESMMDPLFDSWRRVLTPRGVGILLYVSLLLFLILGPMAAITHDSLRNRYVDGYTLENYLYIFARTSSPYLGASPLQAIVNSLFYGFFTIVLSLSFGIVSAYSAVRLKMFGKTLYNALIFLPLGVSSITLALGLVRSYHNVSYLVENSWILVMLAHTLIGFPFAARIIYNGMAKVDPDLLDASRSLGSSEVATFFRVELPIITPSIMVAAAFSFAMSIGEFAATTFIAQPQFATMTVAVYRFMGVRRFGAASAMCVFLIMMCASIFFVIEKVGERESAMGF